MPIHSATFFKALVPGAPLPEESLPVFAFIGRSNAGKSSFINCLTGQKDLARSGSTPGVTKKVNLFLINKKHLFADLPGFGFALMSKHDRKKLQQTIFWYLKNPQINFQQIFLLIDSRVGPTENDLDIIEFLDHQKLPVTIIASKIDKLKNSALANHLKTISLAIPNHTIIPFSSQTGEGKKAVLEIIGI